MEKQHRGMSVFLDVLLVLLGTFIYAAGLYFFIEPAYIAPGGVSGTIAEPVFEAAVHDPERVRKRITAERSDPGIRRPCRHDVDIAVIRTRPA